MLFVLVYFLLFFTSESTFDIENCVGKLELRASVVSPDGKIEISSENSCFVCSVVDADILGKDLAIELKEKGAQKILDEVHCACH